MWCLAALLIASKFICNASSEKTVSHGLPIYPANHQPYHQPFPYSRLYPHYRPQPYSPYYRPPIPHQAYPIHGAPISVTLSGQQQEKYRPKPKYAIKGYKPAFTPTNNDETVSFAMIELEALNLSVLGTLQLWICSKG